MNLPARNMKYGVLVCREFSEYVEQHLPTLVEELTRLGCLAHNIVIKEMPTMHSLLMGTEFFAEYTDVDAVHQRQVSLNAVAGREDDDAIHVGVLREELRAHE